MKVKLMCYLYLLIFCNLLAANFAQGSQLIDDVAMHLCSKIIAVLKTKRIYQAFLFQTK